MTTRIVYASQAGARLDSNVHTGGGTDDTAVLQGILDLARGGGGVRLVMDGASLVSGLTVHSNTTIECLHKECGFFQGDHSDRALLMNANPSDGRIADRNISLLGGTYNQNCRNQAHHVPAQVHYSKAERLVVALCFLGVENLLVRDVTVRDQRTFAFLITNWLGVTLENITLELPGFIHAGNQDGIHVQGPGRFMVLRNIRGRTGDDFIAINADEETIGEGTFIHPCATVGPISDVVVDTVMVDDAAQVLRILSRRNPVDRITVRNVGGNYRSFGFYLSAWDYKSKGLQGDYGSLLFENIDLRQTRANYTYTEPFLFRVSGRHRSLVLRDVRYFDPSDDRYLLHLEGCTDVPDMGDTPADVESLVIDGLHIHDRGSAAQTRPYIKAAGHVRRLVVRNGEILAAKGKGAVFLATEGPHARIDSLVIQGVFAENIAELVSDPGKRIGTASIGH
jgi:Glycosyl hydrolases family 28